MARLICSILWMFLIGESLTFRWIETSWFIRVTNINRLASRGGCVDWFWLLTDFGGLGCGVTLWFSERESSRGTNLIPIRADGCDEPSVFSAVREDLDIARVAGFCGLDLCLPAGR